MGTLAGGATLVVVERFSASRFWSQVREAKATVVNFIGMMMPVLAKQEPSPDDGENSVRLFYGSPAFPPEFLKGFEGEIRHRHHHRVRDDGDVLRHHRADR